MKCHECGTGLRESREDWPYPDLQGVILRGVEVRRCVNDPEHVEVVLPHMDDLHQTLASALLTKRTLLAGSEIRFLRELCAWDVAQLALKLDVKPKVLSQWEADRLGHSIMADRLLRLLAASVLKLPAPLDVLDHIGDAAPPSRFLLQFGPSSWRVVDESDPVSVWISFAEVDREAVIRALEVLHESLKEQIGHPPNRGRVRKASLVGQTGVGKTSLAMSRAYDRALGVAINTLRALRPAPEEPPEADVEAKSTSRKAVRRDEPRSRL